MRIFGIESVKEVFSGIIWEIANLLKCSPTQLFGCNTKINAHIVLGRDIPWQTKKGDPSRGQM